MKTYISMLRGINVSGQKKIKMEDLKKLYESLGFKNVKTYVNSGNVKFNCSDNDISNLINKIERKINNSFGFDVLVFIRTINEMKKLIKNTPFANEDPSKIYITFLSDIPIHSLLIEINKIKDISEKFFISGREIYLFCPNGYGRSKLSNNFFERTLNLSATTRNWNTVNKLLELAEQ